MNNSGAQPVDACDASSRRWFYATLIVTAAAVMAGALLTSQPLLSANDRSRWCTVWSLVERGTYQIDEIIEQPGWDTIDKVRHREHFYSSKPPWLSTVAAGIYWVGKHVFGWDLLRNPRLVTRAVLLLLNLIPTLVALYLICELCERYARSNFTRIFVTFTAAFGTLVTSFAATFNNHTVAACCVTMTLYQLLKILTAERTSGWHFALAGLFAALSCMSELPATLFALAAFAVVLRCDARQAWTRFVPVALLPLTFFFVTNYLATGGWKPFYLYYGTEKYEYIYRGVPSYWMRPAGLDRSLDSPWVYLLHCTVGHHGVLSLSPVVLLSLCSWGRLTRQWRRGEPLSQFENLLLGMGCGLTVVVLCFYLTRTQNYNYGGNSAGLRWMLWLVPFWLLSMIPILDALRSRGFRAAALMCLAVSTFSMTSALDNPWRHPWLFQLMSDWKWIQYQATPPSFDPPRSTWFDRLPRGDMPGQWAEWEGVDGQGELLRMRLTDLGLEVKQTRSLRKLRLTSTRGTQIEWSHDIMVDTALFARQKSVQDLVVWEEPLPSEAERQFVWSLLHGLPVTDRQTYYRRYVLRYIESGMTSDAMECRRSGADVFTEVNGRRYRHHTDLWLSNQVMFGCVQYQQTVFDDLTGEMVARRRMTLAREGKLDATTAETDP